MLEEEIAPGSENSNLIFISSAVWFSTFQVILYPFFVDSDSEVSFELFGLDFLRSYFFYSISQAAR